MLNKQELIDAKVLVPILRNELEESESREQGRRMILVDGFPWNLAQRREFEEAVRMLASKLAAVLCMYKSGSVSFGSLSREVLGLINSQI